MYKIFLFILITCQVIYKAFSNPTCPELKEGMTNVHLVCHTHDDVGWLKTVDQYFYGSHKDITSHGVQYILDSVVAALLRDSTRKFIYVESAFFFRWWNEQNEQMKNDVRNLLENGQLEFVGGGWSMSDEAGTHYNAIIDQMTLGLARLNETFGPVAVPRIAWQIDPFGHSKEQASIFAQMGMDGLFFARLDHYDKDRRLSTKEMELLWKGSNSLGEESWIFTGVLYQHYSAPSGFCFDVFCHDDPIMDDENLEEYNKDEKVDQFLETVADRQMNYATSNQLMTMGGDFQYQYAEMYFKNIDKLIRYVNERQSDGSNVNVVYSTPSCYLDALHAADLEWTTKSDDFFPYSSGDNSYWTGYFTSRPTLKGYIRECNNILQAVKQRSALTGIEPGQTINKLAEAVGVCQHHDAITGTAKQHVTNDYSKMLTDGVAAADNILKEAFSSEATKRTDSYVDASLYEFCPLLNISSCPATETDHVFVVNVYNPIARPRTYYVRVPIEADLGYTVTNSRGSTLPSQVVPLPDQVLNLPGRNSTAKFELVFYADDIPAMGQTNYLVDSTVRGRRNTPDITPIEISSTEDTVLEKGNIRLTIDPYTKAMKALGSKIKPDDMNVTQNLMFYFGKRGSDTQSSGAYIFRPDGEAMEFENLTTIVYTGDIVTEIHQEWSSWATQVTRLYEQKNYIEMEWLVGPIPIDDGIGKEIITRLEWQDLNTDGTFYTDANGREMQKRVVDERETWDFTSTEPVSQNYYPVTSRLILESVDGDEKAAILNDRAQGGTSLADGEMELMVHRRLLYDDGYGVGEALNEEAFGEGLVARGRHYIVHSDFDTEECDFGCQHRSLGEELLLQPIFYFSSASTFVVDTDTEEMEAGVSELPANIRILTLEPRDAGEWLLRLENFYEIDESSNSGNSSVDIQNLFSSWNITDIEELALGANLLKEDIDRLQWKTTDEVEMYYHDDEDFNEGQTEWDEPLSEYSFSPMQIRTFVVKVSPK